MTALVSSDRNRSTGTRPRLRARGPGLGKAFAKAQLSAGTPLPHQGCVFLSVNDRDKPAALEVARSFHQAGFQLVATRGAAAEALASRRPALRVWSLQQIHTRGAAS